MKMKKTIHADFLRCALIPLIIAGLLGLVACGEDGGQTSDSDAAGGGATALSLDLDLPESITGGSLSADADTVALRAARAGTGAACAYMGANEEDPFRNGYEMTKFLVSAVATWTCFTDTLIELADSVAHDDVIHGTDNDTLSPGYDPDDPTHYRISDVSDTQTTLRFYYGYDQDAPPDRDEAPQFFLSWAGTEESDLQGRLIINGTGVNAEGHEPDDPTWMRMDFTYTDSEQYIDTFLRFDTGNPWAEGFRIQLTKDLTAAPLERVFTALGLIAMKAQFIPTEGIDEVPEVAMFTVSDSFGNGAALADFRQLSLPLELNADTGNHLGNYLFDKEDVYFFQEDMDWDWIDKSISEAVYRGGRTTPASGGTWIPFDPSLDMIRTELDLGYDYFTGELCADTDDDCLDLLAAVFEDGFADQEPNQGSDPMDWRSEAIASPSYIDSVFPNGVDWSGAFDMVFTPVSP